MADPPQATRYVVLDSYRALAALSVVAFHYFHRWSGLSGEAQLIPPIPGLSRNPWIAEGSMGVEFFFIISGFVIALTLRKTASPLDFAVKRFARLFPAMLACSLIILVAVKTLRVQPFSQVHWLDFLPSLTFLDPVLFNQAFGLETDWVSGVFWSLFVEVKFYFFAAALFFLQPKFLLRNFFFFSTALCAVFWIAVAAGDPTGLAGGLTLGFFPEFAGFFVAGMAFYEIFSAEDRTGAAPWAILGVSFAYSFVIYTPPVSSIGHSWYSAAGVVVCFLLVLGFTLGVPAVRVFQIPLLGRIGAASYSLYLLHESVGVSAIHRLSQLPGPAWPWIFLVAGGMVVLSIGVYDFVETPARRWIRSLYSSWIRHGAEA